MTSIITEIFFCLEFLRLLIPSNTLGLPFRHMLRGIGVHSKDLQNGHHRVLLSRKVLL